MDHGNPTIDDADGDVLLRRARHVRRRSTPVRVGDRVLVWPAHVDPTVAYHDALHLADGPGLDADVIDPWAVDLRGWNDAGIASARPRCTWSRASSGADVTDLANLDATAQAELVRNGEASAARARRRRDRARSRS